MGVARRELPFLWGEWIRPKRTEQEGSQGASEGLGAGAGCTATGRELHSDRP